MQPWWLFYAIVGWGFSEAWIVPQVAAGRAAGSVGVDPETCCRPHRPSVGSGRAHASSDPMPRLMLVGALAGLGHRCRTH
jgi:hypothetical protein